MYETIKNEIVANVIEKMGLIYILSEHYCKYNLDRKQKIVVIVEIFKDVLVHIQLGSINTVINFHFQDMLVGFLVETLDF